jgi:hypothetical protein
MDHRGNMSSQHRRSKINHSLVIEPAGLTEAESRLLKSRKPMKKMTLEELEVGVSLCRACIVRWKNRRTLRKSWEASLEKFEAEIKKR